MAIGQLLLTYPARHTQLRPLPNRVLLFAVGLGIAVQFGAAALPFTASLLGGAALPLELWGLVAAAAVIAWASAEATARIVWAAR